MVFRYFSYPSTSIRLVAMSEYPEMIGARAWAGLGFEFKDQMAKNEIKKEFQDWLRARCNIEKQSLLDQIKYPQDLVDFRLTDRSNCQFSKEDSSKKIGDLFLLAKYGLLLSWDGVFLPFKKYTNLQTPLGIHHFYTKYIQNFGVPKTTCK